MAATASIRRVGANNLRLRVESPSQSRVIHHPDDTSEPPVACTSSSRSLQPATARAGSPATGPAGRQRPPEPLPPRSVALCSRGDAAAEQPSGCVETEAVLKYLRVGQKRGEALFEVSKTGT